MVFRGAVHWGCNLSILSISFFIIKIVLERFYNKTEQHNPLTSYQGHFQGTVPRPSQRRLTVKKLWVRFDSNRSKKPLLFTLLSMFKRKYYPLTYVSYRRQNMSKWLNEFVKSCVISKYSNIPVRAKGLLPCFGLSACTILANTWPCPPARHHSAAEHKAFPYMVIDGLIELICHRRRVAPHPLSYLL